MSLWYVVRLITYLNLASIFKIQKIRFRLQVESYISDWLFSESRLLASYVSRHKAMAYDNFPRLGLEFEVAGSELRAQQWKAGLPSLLIDFVLWRQFFQKK